jgi:hypothetical protein
VSFLQESLTSFFIGLTRRFSTRACSLVLHDVFLPRRTYISIKTSCKIINENASQKNSVNKSTSRQQRTPLKTLIKNLAKNSLIRTKETGVYMHLSFLTKGLCLYASTS